ncbi:hypothetical protein CCH79_00001531 [Gambusia affinis]|uniref:Endoplasmic reticulum lectin n=1 Tax=Gambusia affinis TaxID=33528 RepID=A0A315VSU6_GAMAF|nr:hypothetical protein CCH79_00001531 [Gambusia affinis]
MKKQFDSPMLSWRQEREELLKGDQRAIDWGHQLGWKYSQAASHSSAFRLNHRKINPKTAEGKEEQIVHAVIHVQKFIAAPELKVGQGYQSHKKVCCIGVTSKSCKTLALVDWSLTPWFSHNSSYGSHLKLKPPMWILVVGSGATRECFSTRVFCLPSTPDRPGPFLDTGGWRSIRSKQKRKQHASCLSYGAQKTERPGPAGPTGRWLPQDNDQANRSLSKGSCIDDVMLCIKRYLEPLDSISDKCDPCLTVTSEGSVVTVLYAKTENDVAAIQVTSCVWCSVDIRLPLSFLTCAKPKYLLSDLSCSEWEVKRLLTNMRRGLQELSSRAGEMIAGLMLVLFGGLLGVCSDVSANRGGYPSFTDEIPFKITWPGSEFRLPTSGALYSEDDFVIMTTTEKEKYKCLLPSLANGEEDDDKGYGGPSPGELLEPLFKRSSCSYRIESYWTYEVCHGKHVRQYHEEKETGQKISVQEYYLGNMDQRSQSADTDQDEERENAKAASQTEVSTKNIEGQLTPYYSVEMGYGTPCTLKQNLPRSTSVLYVCHPEAKHEILSIAEVTTCEYEVVVLTPLLCTHPKYRFKSSPVNAIFCQALEGSPLQPQRLTQLDKEQEELLKPPFSTNADIREEGVSPVREEAFTSTHKPMTVGGQVQVTVGTTHISRLTDDQLIKEFLSGLYCLQGGVGWWKYEFCYGKHVHQYHEDKEQGKNIVVVGNWNAEEHVEWAKKNVARSYQLKEDGAQKVKVVSHFYGHGDLCDLTGKPRQVVVKLKCKESESPHAVTVYMMEPQTCQYVLGVESPVICRILDTADEHGLLSIPS